MQKTQQLSNQLWQAYREGKPIRQLSATVDFDVNEAYLIQHEQRLMRSKDERLVGWKMGLTSEAKRRQMNLHSPLYGFLTDRMQVEGTFSLKGSIHPRIEPEIAFRLKRDLPMYCTYEQAYESIGTAAPALEILDSRYSEFRYFSLQDVIADNSSSYRYLCGKWFENWQTLDLKQLGMRLYLNGNLVEQGMSSAISGDPIVSLVQLSELLAHSDLQARAGQIVLAGSATTAVPLQPGKRIHLEVDGFETLRIAISE